MKGNFIPQLAEGSSVSVPFTSSSTSFKRCQLGLKGGWYCRSSSTGAKAMVAKVTGNIGRGHKAPHSRGALTDNTAPTPLPHTHLPQVHRADRLQLRLLQQRRQLDTPCLHLCFTPRAPSVPGQRGQGAGRHLLQ